MADSESNYEEVSGTLVAKTIKAILLKIDRVNVWIPLSQISKIVLISAEAGVADKEIDSDELVLDTELSVLVKTWILDKLGVNYGN